MADPSTFSRRSVMATSGIALLVLAGFLWDLATPLGYVPWLLYVPALLLTLALPYRWSPPALAGLCTILILVGYLDSPSGQQGNMQAAFFNRTLGIAILWLVAASCLFYKRTETSLRKNEAQFRVIFEQAAVGVAQIEIATGRFVQVNQRYCDIVGLSAEQMLGFTFMNLTHTEDLQENLDNMARLVAGDVQTFTMDKRCVRPDGSIVWVALTVSPMWTPGDRPDYYIAVVEDITARKQAERRLALLRRELQDILDSAPAMIWYKDDENRILRANKPAAESLGLSPKELAGRSTYDLYPKDAAKYHADDLDVIRSGQPKLGIVEPYQVGRNTRWVRTDKIPYRNEAGEIAGVVVFAQDITERQRAEQRQEGHRLVLEMLATGQPLARVLETLVRNTEAQAPGILGSILLLDQEGKRLAHGAAPSLPPDYCRAVDGIEIGPEVGSCGTAAYRKMTVIVEDIATDPLWRHSSGVAQQYGLAACWSKPICSSDGRVLGTFAMYYREKRAPGPAELELLDAAGQIAAIAIERAQAEERLHASEQRLHLAIESSDIGFFDWDLDSNRVYYSPRWKSQLGYGEEDIREGQEEWENRLHPDDRDRTLAMVRAYHARPWPDYEVEFRLRHKDGSYRWIATRAIVQKDGQGRARRMLGTHLDITERKRVEEHLIQSQAELHALMAHMESVREGERTRIARELHDELGQALTGLKMDVVSLAKGLEAMPRTGETTRLLGRTSEMQDLIDASVQGIRRLVLELRPPVLDHFDLSSALEWLTQDFQKRHRISCSWRPPAGPLQLQASATTALFRIAQEALTNVARHAKATQVDVRLAQEQGQVCLTVTDNGLGLTDRAAASPVSFGLIGIKERARLLGGTATLQGRPGHGTQVTIRIPWEPAS